MKKYQNLKFNIYLVLYHYWKIFKIQTIVTFINDDDKKVPKNLKRMLKFSNEKHL
jgi:hypothetical protein